MEGLLPDVDGDHLALGHDVDECAVGLDVAVDAERPHVLERGADELDGAALAGVALLEEVDRPVERLPAPLLQGCNSIRYYYF